MDHKIKLVIGLALDSLDSLASNICEHNSYDFAFIDGDKSLYIEYIDKVLPLMKRGSFLMIDNVLWSGKVVDENARASDPDTRAVYQSVTNAL